MPNNAIVKYVDCITPDDLIKIYPEYQGINFVNVDYLAPANQLPFEDESINFIINAHVIEHLSNPIGAILEWYRVLTRDGIIYSIIPDKDFTYDRERPCTPLGHLIADYKSPSRERDVRHLYEHVQMVEGITDRVVIEERVFLIQNNNDPMIHYHVWNYQTIKKFFRYVAKLISLKIILITSDKTFETIVITQKN